MAAKEDLARAFIATRAFKWDPDGGFRLASGVRSHYYVDCRELLAHPVPRLLVARLAFEAIRSLAFECIGGLEIGAIPLATAISDYGYQATPRREWRTFVVRKQPKDHGLGKRIEGAAAVGERALIVDDVLTSGNSILKSVAAARGTGLVVTHALVIVDREEQGARAKLEAEDLRVISLLKVRELRAAMEPA
ncbi:MAG: orotate phosphoribosyltransferase [Nitrospirales bacterium]